MYQVGIREFLDVLSLHLGRRSEKKVIKADRPIPHRTVISGPFLPKEA